MGDENMSEENKPKCFVIMPISDQQGYPKGHFTKVYEQIFKQAIEDAGYNPYRVDEDNICDSIIVKIFEGIQNCEMALCDLSGRNPNVLYELGLRQAYDKPVVLVQDEKTERIFDVSGINTIPYNSDRLYESVIEARQKISQALKDSKNGKGYSLVKIVKANEAKFPEGDLSGSEKTEIMLKTIMDELVKIKNDVKLENNSIMIDSVDDVTSIIEKQIATLELEVLRLKFIDGEEFKDKARKLRNKIESIIKNLDEFDLNHRQEVLYRQDLKRVDSILESYILGKSFN